MITSDDVTNAKRASIERTDWAKVNITRVRAVFGAADTGQSGIKCNLKCKWLVLPIKRGKLFIL